VFYKKLEAEFNKSLIEFSEGSDRQQKISKCAELYEEALKIAKDKLKISDTVRLTLTMSYGQFSDEFISDESKKEIVGQEVRKIYDEALEALEQLSDKEFIKAAAILNEI
jgi:hypothetical protein